MIRPSTTATISAVVAHSSDAVVISPRGADVVSIAALALLAAAVLAWLAIRLHRQRVLLNKLFEQSPQAVVLVGMDDRVVRINREFSRVFGYSPQEAVGRSLTELIALDESRDQAEKNVQLAAHGQRVEAEGLRRRKDGTHLHVAITHVPVPVPLPGRLVAVYAIYLDITERKQAEAELQQSFAQLRALAARLQSAREEERTRAAREIHDELGQALTAIKIDLATLPAQLPTDKDAAVQRSQSSLKLLDKAIQSVRRIATELRPGILDDLGLVAAVGWAAEDFRARTGTKCHVSLPDVEMAIDPERATAIFRILQETLTNIARHASATQVNIRLTEENGALSLEVHDDGQGIREEQLLARQSLGIRGMRERAVLLGGELTITGSPGTGTIVRARIPEPVQKQREYSKC